MRGYYASRKNGTHITPSRSSQATPATGLTSNTGEHMEDSSDYSMPQPSSEPTGADGFENPAHNIEMPSEFEHTSPHYATDPPKPSFTKPTSSEAPPQSPDIL